MLLTGKNAVITGGGTGIGLAIARKLAAEGCNVAITGRRLDVLEQAADSFGGYAVKMDVANEASVVTGMQSIADHFGSIDICIANAGIAEGQNDTDIIERNTQSISERAHISHDEARALMVDLNPHGRLITAEEVASAALWLCSPGSDSFDGQAMEISGGQP